MEARDAAGDRWSEDPVDLLLSGSASWLVSLCLHLVAILVLALFSLPVLPGNGLLNLTASVSPQEEGFDDAPLIEFEELNLDDSLTTLDAATDAVADAFADEVVVESFAPSPAASFAPPADLGLAAPSAGDFDQPEAFGSGNNYGRGAAARRRAVVRNGGSDASEAAVERALEWLANHQNSDGTWSLVHNVGRCNGRCPNPSRLGGGRANPGVTSLRAGTGLALLPFLGAGQTHLEGKHRQTVARGLQALVAMGRPNENGPGASWADQAGRMYSHGIAALVLTEALGITGDSDLALPAQAALDFIAYAQGPDGGWRYSPKQIGDTSVTGWQVMALKSGFLANLRVPPRVARGANNFFDTVQRDAGARYGYFADPPLEFAEYGDPTGTRSAVALLGRIYLGWQRENAALARGARLLAEEGPSWDDVYFNYYAAQVLFQYTNGQGELWRGWNERLREQLIAQQDRSGHPRGSWFIEAREDPALRGHNAIGGRLYHTSLATMTLEVYYRYLPIYKLNTESVLLEKEGL